MRSSRSSEPTGRRLFSVLNVKDNLLPGTYTRKDREAIARDLKEVYRRFPILEEKHRQYADTPAAGSSGWSPWGGL
ncbi:hypothetical protein [Nitratifractor sp.]